MTLPVLSERPKHDPVSRRRFQTIGARMFGSHLLAIAAAITLVSFALLSLVRTYFLDELERSLRIQSDLISRAILPDADLHAQEPGLPAAFNTVQQQQVDRLSVQIENQSAGPQAANLSDALASLEQANISIATSLQTDVYIFTTDRQILLAPPNSDAAQIAESAGLSAALQGHGSRMVVARDGKRSLVITSPLSLNGEISAALALSHPMDDLEAVFQSLWLRLVVSALISMALTSIISLLFTRSVQKPLLQLRTASEHLRRGDYDYPLPPERKDELGDLSHAFEAMRAQLKSTEELRTRFLSDVAHELRTPLTSIKGLTETLQDGAIDDLQVRDRFLTSIERETDRLIRLTRDLLTLTRADVEGIPLREEAVRLTGLVEEIFTQFEVEARRKSVQLVLQDNGLNPVVSVDPDRIGQVLINLIDNAMRHAPENSSIEVHMAARKRSALPPDFLNQTHYKDLAPDWVVLSVTDQGPGIPTEDQARVFDRFYRVERARDRQRGGSGLGLPIAKAIIEAHGGWIWFVSPADRSTSMEPAGTSVYLALPG